MAFADRNHPAQFWGMLVGVLTLVAIIVLVVIEKNLSDNYDARSAEMGTIQQERTAFFNSQLAESRDYRKGAVRARNEMRTLLIDIRRNLPRDRGSRPDDRGNLPDDEYSGDAGPDAGLPLMDHNPNIPGAAGYGTETGENLPVGSDRRR